MSQVTYTYDVETETANGGVNFDDLAGEISAAGLSAAVERIDSEGGSYEGGVLTGGTIRVVMQDFVEESALGAVVAAHGGEAPPVVPVAGIADLGGGTLAELNALVTDVTLDGINDPRNDPNAIHGGTAGEVNVLPEKTNLEGSDLLLIEDSAASYEKKKVQLVNMPLKVVAYGESEGASSTTSRTYQRKLRVTFTAKAKDYLVLFSCEVRRFNRNGEFRVQVDNTSTLVECEYRNGGYDLKSGFQRLTLTAGSHDVDVDYRTTKNGRTVYIRRARITVLETI